MRAALCFLSHDACDIKFESFDQKQYNKVLRSHASINFFNNMQPTLDNSTIVSGVRNGSFIAQPTDDTLAWGQGSIQPQSTFLSDNAQDDLIKAVLDSLEPVSEKESTYSSCTDGRCPVRLLNDEMVPVREQMVGADMVSAFYVAESLGERFYRDASAPVEERVREVANFLQENGIMPSTHIGCGAAAGFTAIIKNAVEFSKNPAFVARLQSLLPNGVYDENLHAKMLQDNEARLARNAYEGLAADTFVAAVEAVSGRRAIAELKDDDRGVHGHVEEAIMRVRVPGYAINEFKLMELTGGREVFGVNDARMEKFARLFGRGQDADYQIAYMALEDFASTGHGTLAKDLPTYIVTAL